MKKIVVYLLGILTGVLLTLLVLLIIGRQSESEEGAPNVLLGAEFFEQPGEVMEVSYFQVFQAIDENYALAQAFFQMSDVLIYSPEGTPFYDDQKLECGEGECFRQVGLFRYECKIWERTLPIV